MTVFFCLDDVFETLAKRDPADFSLNLFVPVHMRRPDCNGFREDALTLSSQPQLLDLTDPKACYQMASLIEEVPLYHINLELMIDEALSQRHHNQNVRQAITKAFEGQPLPNTIGSDPKKSNDGLDGNLRHPMIGHLDKVTLCKIYLNFMRALPHGQGDFSFEKFIIGSHTGPYHTQFDGYIAGEIGKVQADILLGFGVRADYDPRQPIENYVENGRKQAVAMRITEGRELLMAWMEADHYQTRRCHDIDRILTLRGLPRMPNWVRTDVFHCLEKEAMKQILATKLQELDPQMGFTAKLPAINKAITLSAQGQIDENLQKLLSQTLNAGTPYSGVANTFYEQGLARQKEARVF